MCRCCCLSSRFGATVCCAVLPKLFFPLYFFFGLTFPLTQSPFRSTAFSVSRHGCHKEAKVCTSVWVCECASSIVFASPVCLSCCCLSSLLSLSLLWRCGWWDTHSARGTWAHSSTLSLLLLASSVSNCPSSGVHLTFSSSFRSHREPRQRLLQGCSRYAVPAVCVSPRLTCFVSSLRSSVLVSTPSLSLLWRCGWWDTHSARGTWAHSSTLSSLACLCRLCVWISVCVHMTNLLLSISGLTFSIQISPYRSSSKRRTQSQAASHAMVLVILKCSVFLNLVFFSSFFVSTYVCFICSVYILCEILSLFYCVFLGIQSLGVEIGVEEVD